MMTVCQKMLLSAGAYFVACADARRFGRGGFGLATTGSGIRWRHRQRQRGGRKPYPDTIVATALLRGGGNGIEANPEYVSDVDETDDRSEEQGSESDTDDNDNVMLNFKPNRRRHNHHSKYNKENIKLVKSKSNKDSYNKRVQKIVKVNQINFYILLAIFAFRKDIYNFAIQYHIIPTSLDPVTGERKITVRWSTDVLKLVLVGVVIRRYFLPGRIGNTLSAALTNGSEEDGNKNNQTRPVEQSPSPKRIPIPVLPLILLLLFLPMFRQRAGMLSAFLLPMILQGLSGESDPDSPFGRLFLMMGRGQSDDLATRMAYLPPLEQHYAFEQLNERYYRDWGAWRKALPTNPMVSASSASTDVGRGAAIGSGSGSMASFFSSLRNARKLASSPSPPSPTANNGAKTKKYPSEYNNGTVIVMDMTKLDMQASKMKNIRDQISFLIHLVETELAPLNVTRQTDDGRQGSEDGTVNESDLTASTSSTCNATETSPVSNISQQSSSPSLTVEVIVLLESPGGGVSQYGLAASHLQRLRSTPNVLLTVCIDEIAASGGYMMACMSSPNQLYCAPFAMVGSIGVIGQALNIQKTLESHGVRPYVFRGGKMKNPVGLVGEVTEEGVAAMQESVERIHDAFRGHVAGARGQAFSEATNAMLMSKSEEDEEKEGPILKRTGTYFHLGCAEATCTPTNPTAAAASIERVMDEVATGDVFLGTQALELGLVDRLITSDEYIAERIRQGARVLKLMQYHKRPPGLSGLLLPPTHPHSRQLSLVEFLKKFVVRVTSGVLAWAEDVLAAGGAATVPTFSAAVGASDMNDLQ